MPVLLQINEICKAYGAATILDDATASFSSEQKIGVIGRNGAGKSTLCRIITGDDTADSGSVNANADLRLGYLEQHDSFDKNEGVLDFLMRRTEAESWECAQKAARFQINQEILKTPVASLPGGFQTRVKLTAMLLGEPNFLILDEPSNYLDLTTLILLENFLINFRGGYLVVSHDREFLKRTCDHTLEIENGSLTLYPGDIEEYFEFKEVQAAHKRAHNVGVAKKREQLQEFINRFRAKASTASRAQSKMKQLEKLKTIEIGHEAASARIIIPQVERKAGTALYCEDLAIGYPEKDVATHIDFQVERGKHVAVLGDNGEGKTTFLKTITGDLTPKAGRVRWASGVKLAYYAQHVFSSLSPGDTVHAHLHRQSAQNVTNQEILRMAGCFLFKGDDVKKKVSVLSGGERARLILAGLLLSKSNVLLLDEPTNHLDFETVEALSHALKRFHGTVFFISHDRTFVNLIATTILEVKNGEICRYPGKYEDYVYHLEMIVRGEKVEPAVTSSHKKTSSGGAKSRRIKATTAVEERPQLTPEDEKLYHEMTKLKKRMTKAEKRVKHATTERDKLLAEMERNPLHYSKERNEQLKGFQIDLEEAEDDWLSLQDKMDKLKAKQKKSKEG